MTEPSTNTITWMLVSRIAGLVIVLSLLAAFIVSSALGTNLDRTTVLAFLAIAGGLLGIPAGWYLVKVKQNNSRSGSED